MLAPSDELELAAEEERVHLVEDWAEVRRLHDRDGLSGAAIARRLGMIRNTVTRLLGLSEPPR